MSDFKAAFNFVIEREGDYSNDPVDRGGATNFGITQEVLSRWRKKAVTPADVRNMTKKEAENIYRVEYWNRLNLDEIKDPLLATIIFDQAVNRGQGTVAKEVQIAVGAEPDGVIGPKTLALINEKNPIRTAFNLIITAQKSYISIVKKRPEQIKFLSGWINRTHFLLDLLID